MDLRRIRFTLILALGATLMLVTAGWYYEAARRYVSTNYAWVDAPVAWLKAPTAGTVLQVRRAAGQGVRAGEALFTISSANGRYRLRSPLGGRLGMLAATVGQPVAAGQTLGAVVDLHHLSLAAEVPESQIRRLAPGQSAEVSIDAQPGRTWWGRVEAIGQSTLAAGVGVPNVGQFSKQLQWVPVRIGFKSRALDLLAGESAEVRIHLGR